MSLPSTPGDSTPRAMRAEEAGKLLAELIGLDEPIPAATMWRYARQNLIKTIQLGRLRYFRTTDLREFVTTGGSGFDRRRVGV